MKARLRLVPYVLGRYRGMALLRACYWLWVRGWETEVCTECGRPVRIVWWCHDSLLWREVTGNAAPEGSSEAAGGIWCIYCFDAEARRLAGWVEWAPLNLVHLQDEARKLPK